MLCSHLCKRLTVTLIVSAHAQVRLAYLEERWDVSMASVVLTWHSNNSRDMQESAEVYGKFRVLFSLLASPISNTAQNISMVVLMV